MKILVIHLGFILLFIQVGFCQTAILKPNDTGNNEPFGFENAESIRSVKTDRQSYMLHGFIKGTSNLEDAWINTNFPQVYYVRVQQKNSLVGDNPAEMPDMIVSMQVKKKDLKEVLAGFETILSKDQIRASFIYGQVVQGSIQNPSMKDPKGLWAVVLQDIIPGKFTTYRDYISGIREDLYDKYGFEDCSAAVNIKMKSVNGGILNLEVPDVIITSYVPFPNEVFSTYLKDEKFPFYDDLRQSSLSRYASFYGTVNTSK